MDSHPFRFIRNLGRTREIATVLLNYGFGDLVQRLSLGRYLRWGKRVLLRRKEKPDAVLTRGQRIRLSLESLGPTYIKFGQILSTRPDLLPEDVIRELESLQEQVPSFASEKAIEILEEELGKPVAELFREFNPQPIAAGSLGQVHQARHWDGTLLAIKIRRPGAVGDIERDLSLMLELAALLERHIPESRVFDPIGLVNNFARTIRRELNFDREASSMREFTHLFRNDATLYIPRVYQELCTEAVLSMEFIDGIKPDNPDELRRQSIDPAEVAANGARIFMKQSFVLGLFHGDPHPGNVRILADGSICLLDYGMIGTLEEETRELLVDMFLSVIRKDVRAAVDVIQKLGEPFRSVDEPLLRVDVRDFIENYYGRELERLNVGSMLSDFLSIISHHGIRIPGDMLLLVRALVNLEGTGRRLDPNFNLAQHLAPFIEETVRRRYSFKYLGGRFIDETQTFLRLAHDLPLNLGKTIEKLSRDNLKVKLEHRSLDHFITEIDRSSNRLVIGLVVSALLVASALIIRTDRQMMWLSGSVFLFSSILGMWLVYGIFRSGRL